MAETGKTTTDTKTTVVKEEKATTQSPTTGATTKVETKTVTTTAPTDTSAIKTAKPIDKNALTSREKKIVNITTFGSGVGLVAGLSYAFVKGKGFWAYVGYGILGSVVLGTTAGLGAKALLKDETKKA
jgi:hypothetical protein